MKWLLLCGLLGLVPNVEAQLNEDIQEVIAHSGQPINRNVDAVCFLKDGIVVLATIHERRIWSLIFATADHSAFTEDQIETLLASSAEGSTWTQRASLSHHREWTRADDRAFAAYSVSGRILFIDTLDSILAKNSARTEKEKSPSAQVLKE